ncbi:phage tail sheath subtilisin-like domain-containing protein [Zhenpiania hominis]|uniref:Phage tail sheath subtilisin-like domain-containing protein n=1 Tax=Zhenpiania hominis TaxID=2763644 RepID=A0A923NQD2_9FIRM|nr:phage tail sheath subtilisin-like domain-containing protein [Zhenpiania hominis]MBC6681317.1 phage tail sheath subtilisin-like domain-containing protein [Zhenpiania hominis]
MGLPAMNIIFTAAAIDSVRRSDRGAIGMIVKDAVPETNPVTIHKVSDIPGTLSESVQEQVRLALKGYVSAPSKVVLYVLESEAEDYTDALDYFSIYKVNWICCPTAETDGQAQAVATWVKEQREARNKVKVVLPNTAADCEGVVNYTTETASIGDDIYTTEEFCSRIAGVLAGTPLTQGATFAVLEDVTDCEKLSRSELDTAIDAGKFVLYYDGEKVKVARAVNSMTTVQKGKSESWKKIKVVETMDMIYDDLILLAEDNYIGKYLNTFDNKCLLLSAIRAYLTEMERVGAVQDCVVDFDVETIREYIVTNKGVSREVAEAMPDQEVKKQYTDEKVFLAATMTISDVMEDITLQITV